MIKALIVGFVIALPMGVAGYMAEPYLMRPPDPGDQASTSDTTPKERYFKMPLGKFTMQVARQSRIIHLLIDLDLYLKGAHEFERLNGAKGRAILRDATITVISELAETELWIDDKNADHIDKAVLAEKIVRRLNPDFPMVRTARINELTAGVTIREHTTFRIVGD